MNTNKHHENKLQRFVKPILKIYLTFLFRVTKNISHDLKCLLGGWTVTRLLQPENLLKSFHVRYMRRQSKLEKLTKEYKQQHVIFSETRGRYCEMITLLDGEGNAVNSNDGLQKQADFPSFEEASQTAYAKLKPVELSDQVLAPKIETIPEMTPRLISRIRSIITQLGKVNVQALTEQFQFKSFPQTLPKVIEWNVRKLPSSQNLLASLSGFWSITILVLYVASLLAEGAVFTNLAVSLLGMSTAKSILFALTLGGVSFILGIFLYAPLLRFVRSKGYTPWAYRLFLASVLLYVITAGYLNYNQFSNNRIEGQYLNALENLQTLQTALFLNPKDADLQTDLIRQEKQVERLSQSIGKEDGVTRIMSQILYVLASLTALLISAMLLALKIIITRVGALKRKQRKALKSIMDIESRYVHQKNILVTAQKLLMVYLTSLGEHLAVKTLLKAPPNANVILGLSNNENNRKGEERTDTANPIKEIRLNQPEEVISEEMYKETYTSN